MVTWWSSRLLIANGATTKFLSPLENFTFKKQWYHYWSFKSFGNCNSQKAIVKLLELYVFWRTKLCIANGNTFESTFKKLNFLLLPTQWKHYWSFKSWKTKHSKVIASNGVLRVSVVVTGNICYGDWGSKWNSNALVFGHCLFIYLLYLAHFSFLWFIRTRWITLIVKRYWCLPWILHPIRIRFGFGFD